MAAKKRGKTSKKTKKKTVVTSASVASIQAKRSEKWIAQFDGASPQARYDMTVELLQNTPELLEPEELLYVVAGVNEILAHFNRIDQMITLCETLHIAAPDLYPRFAPVVAMTQLQEQLFHQKDVDISDTLAQVRPIVLEAPEFLDSLIQMLATYRQDEPLTAFAQALHAELLPRRGEDIMELKTVLRGYLIGVLLEQTDQALLRGEKVVWADFRAQAVSLAMESSDITAIRQDLHMSNSALWEEFTSHYPPKYHGDMAAMRTLICRLLYPQGFSYYLSNQISQMLVGVWLYHEPLRKLRRKKRYSEAEIALDHRMLEAYAEELLEEMEDAHLACVYFWGVPLAIEALMNAGFLSQAYGKSAQKIFKQARKTWLKETEMLLWIHDYVHTWPRTPGWTQKEWESECQRFQASRQAPRPLPTDSEASVIFDLRSMPPELQDEMDDLFSLMEDMMDEMEVETPGELVAILEQMPSMPGEDPQMRAQILQFLRFMAAD